MMHVVGIVRVTMMREWARFAVREKIALGRATWLTRMLRFFGTAYASIAMTVPVSITVTVPVTIAVLLLGLTFLVSAVPRCLLDGVNILGRELAGGRSGCGCTLRRCFGDCCNYGRCRRRVPCDDVLDCNDSSLRTLRSGGVSYNFCSPRRQFGHWHTQQFLIQTFLLLC